MTKHEPCGEFGSHPVGGHAEAVGNAARQVDYRGMAEVIRLNCKDLDTAAEVLRGYLENARYDAVQTLLRESILPLIAAAQEDISAARERGYDNGREDHRAHDCCQGRMTDREPAPRRLRPLCGCDAYITPHPHKPDRRVHEGQPCPTERVDPLAKETTDE